MQLLARTIRGIESLVSTEIQEPGVGAVRRLRHREVWFEAPDAHKDLLGLRTPDDVLLVAAVVDGVGPEKAALRRLAHAVGRADLHWLAEVEPSARIRAKAAPGIDVSASFLGRRAYNRYDLEDAVGVEVARALGVPYHSRRGGVAPPPGTSSWRVTVEGGEAVVALRLGARPLHRRTYKIGSVPGTLHPPLAAAMARLAGPAGTILDPCCGAGTTLIEAAALHTHKTARYVGVDHRPQAVSRVLTPGGRVVVLLHERQDQLALAARHGFRAEHLVEVSLSGLHPAMVMLRREAG